jgi:hypothetical protein
LIQTKPHKIVGPAVKAAILLANQVNGFGEVRLLHAVQRIEVGDRMGRAQPRRTTLAAIEYYLENSTSPVTFP